MSGWQKEIGVVELRSHVESLNEPGLLEELDEALGWKRRHRSWVYYYCPDPCPDPYCEGKFSSKELYVLHMEQKKRVAVKRGKARTIVANGWTEEEKLAADAACSHGGRVETICRLVKELGEGGLLTESLVGLIKDYVSVGIIENNSDGNNNDMSDQVRALPSTSFLHAVDDDTIAKLESHLNDVVHPFRHSLDFLGDFPVVLDSLENKIMKETSSSAVVVEADVEMKQEEGKMVVAFGGVVDITEKEEVKPGAWQSVKDHHYEAAKDLVRLFNHMSKLLESHNHTQSELGHKIRGLQRICDLLSSEDELRKNNAGHIPVRYRTLLLQEGLELDDTFTDILESAKAKDPRAKEFPHVGEQEDATVRTILQTCLETTSRQASVVDSTILMIQNSVDKVLGRFLEHTSGVDYRLLLISLLPANQKCVQ